MGDDPLEAFESGGVVHRQLLESSLPAGWKWSCRRVLDFGCGAGRVLRQFAPETQDAEFWGCDIDRPSVDWLRENLSPPFEVFEVDERPGLPQADGYFDLIYAFSVYTHLTDHWAGWLLEHHRVLKEGGLLLATILSEGMIEDLTGEQWEDDKIGMNALVHGHPWDEGGPITLHSPWWIRAHWGRAFEILELRPKIAAGSEPTQGIVLMRKKPVELTIEDLQRIEPDEPREITAMQHHIRQLRDETIRLRAESAPWKRKVLRRLRRALRRPRGGAS